jgi:AcrR family transcriptional regulator
MTGTSGKRQVERRSEPASSVRRDEILRISGEVFAERGFALATVRHVADACDIQSGSLYHHFASKEAMVIELLRTYANELVVDYTVLVEGPESAEERLRAMIRRSIEAVVLRRAQLRILHNDQAYLLQIDGYAEIESLLDKVRVLWLEVIEAGMREGVFRSDVDPMMIYRTTMGTVLSAVRWFDPHGPIGATLVADTIANILVRGISMTARA